MKEERPFSGIQVVSGGCWSCAALIVAIPLVLSIVYRWFWPWLSIPLGVIDLILWVKVVICLIPETEEIQEEMDQLDVEARQLYDGDGQSA